MKIIATIEARMTSSRLPGKVMLPVSGEPILGHLIDRISKVPSLQEIVLATTINPQDDVLVAFAANKGISSYRGSENNVMERVLGAAKSHGADIIVELTGDNPLIDPDVIEQTIQAFIHNPCDYASNVVVRSYPIGMDTQVFSLEVLKKSFALTQRPLDLEHVTRHIRQNPEIFRHIHLVAPPSCHWPDLSLTLDEKADYELISNIIHHFSGDRQFSCADIIRLLKNDKSTWFNINAAVKRKGINA